MVSLAIIGGIFLIVEAHQQQFLIEISWYYILNHYLLFCQYLYFFIQRMALSKKPKITQEKSDSWKIDSIEKQKKSSKQELLEILPVEFEKWELIGREYPWIEGFIIEILWKKKAWVNELTYVKTNKHEKFYLYPDWNPVYIKNSNWTNTEDLVNFYFQLISFKWREISNWSQLFYTDNFQIIDTTDDLGHKAEIYRIHEEMLWERKCLNIWTANGREHRDYVVDQETWEILRVWWKSIKYVDDKKIETKDKGILQNVCLNKWWKKWIYTNTLQEVKIEWIEESIAEISFGNHNMFQPYLWLYQVMFAKTDTWKVYLFDVNTMKVLKIPGIDFEIDAEKLINKRFDRDSYSSDIRSDDFNIFQKEIFSIPLYIPYLTENVLPRDIAIYKENWLPVKISWTDLFVCWFDTTYTSDRAKIINWEKYGEVVVLDTEEWKNYWIYLREWDLSVLEATLLNWEKVIINNLLDEENRVLKIDWKEMIIIKYDKYKQSMLVDKNTFQEVVINIVWTNEEIKHIWNCVFNIWWQEIIPVGTESWKHIYVYRKSVTPLEIPWIPWFVEDMIELENGKWNMMVNGKWNLVRVKT